MRRLTLLSGPVSPLPSRARRWLAAQDGYVAVEVLDPASSVAARRYPGLVKEPLLDLVAISDGGAVWTGPAAWIMALWALRSTRADALRYARPAWRAGARARLLALADAESAARQHDGPSGLDVLCVLAWIAGTMLLGTIEPGMGAVVGTLGLLLGLIGGLRCLTRCTLAFSAWLLAMGAAARWAPGLVYATGLALPVVFLVVLVVSMLARPTPPPPRTRAPRPFDGASPPRPPSSAAPSCPAPLFGDPSGAAVSNRTPSGS